jgi:glycosyltransferase involved in cell wall biosynthesis
MKVTILQPANPPYRHDFFDRLYKRYGDAFEVAYSETVLDGFPQDDSCFKWARKIGPLRTLVNGLEWQTGAVRLPVSSRDVLVVAGTPRMITTLILLLKARLVGARTVWWGHYWSSTSKTWRFFLRLPMMLLAHGVLFYTDVECSEYRALTGGLDRRPMSALNNGIAVDQIQKLRQDYSAETRPASLLFIGRLTEKAHLTMLLEAMTYANCADIKLHVIGWGSAGPALQTKALELGIDTRVTWHGALVDEERIAEIANQCRAFVYPGPVGLSLIHSMAYGLPAILHSNRWRHGPEIAAFTDGQTGVAFQPNDAADLAQKVATLIPDTDTLNGLSREALAITSSSFNTREMARRFGDFIDALQIRPRVVS